MQPYFFPYIGYFQLISSVDKFILYDNIKYTKKGWINRNRILLNGKDETFSLPLKRDSDSLNVCSRKLALDFPAEKMIRQIKSAYLQAPYFSQTIPLIEEIIRNKDQNLFNYLYNSISLICHHLDIKTPLIISSEVEIDHALKNQEKVLAFCRELQASTYINSIGGIELYAASVFREFGVELKFIKSLPFHYSQFGHPFVPALSIIDVMMFNPIELIREKIMTGFELI